MASRSLQNIRLDAGERWWAAVKAVVCWTVTGSCQPVMMYTGAAIMLLLAVTVGLMTNKHHKIVHTHNKLTQYISPESQH